MAEALPLNCSGPSDIPDKHILVPLDNLSMKSYLSGRDEARTSLIPHMSDILDHGYKVILSISKETDLSEAQNNYKNFFLGFFEDTVQAMHKERFKADTEASNTLKVINMASWLFEKHFKDSFKLALQGNGGSLFELRTDKNNQPILMLSSENRPAPKTLEELVTAFNETPKTFSGLNFDLTPIHGSLVKSAFSTPKAEKKAAPKPL